MSDNDGKFCVGCGAMLPDDATFCPSCGHSVDGSENPYASSRNVTQAPDNLGTARIFIFIYAALAAVLGLMAIVSGSVIDQEMWDEMMKSLPESMIGYWSDVDLDAFKLSMMLEGSIILASGICAAVSGILAKKRVKWMFSLVFCVVASFLTLGFGVFGIIFLIIGLFFSYKIYQNKDAFEN